MEKVKIAVNKTIKWLISNLGEIAFVLMIASAMIAVRSIYSNEAQDYLFWAWSSLCLACSFILHRYSFMVKSVKCFLLSLLEMFIILIVSGHYVFGIQLLPRFSGPGLGLCVIMLLYYAVSLYMIIPDGRSHKWTKAQKMAMIVTLAIAVLAAGLVLFVPVWIIILILDVAAMSLTLVFRMFTEIHPEHLESHQES